MVKSLALSKVIFSCSSMETPSYFAGGGNIMVFDFAWNHKPAKIKKTTLINLERGWFRNERLRHL